uniref:Macaca fascicularis brain cDNA clone: QtrA-17863, similar to human aryl hydrocarbon receptor nuclear translocator (ARNT),transcript variant 3, mRNA, RefSeq: NM_178427.1 n=1 Tax=Macaca fascicularis TaxID=9541 RepID=I7GJF7_MACFA|nr:unnamed protein product [Macaca fascicularis]
MNRMLTYLCLQCLSPSSPHTKMHSRLLFTSSFRAYPGSKDWNSEKGRSTVFHENVYGLKEIIYLPNEVSVKLRIVIRYRKDQELRVLFLLELSWISSSGLNLTLPTQMDCNTE